MDDLLPDTFYDYCRVGYVCLVFLLYLADNTRVSLLKTITFYLRLLYYAALERLSISTIYQTFKKSSIHLALLYYLLMLYCSLMPLMHTFNTELRTT